MLQSLRAWARRLKRNGLALWFAWRDPATPWPLKVLCWLVVAYALSPIDLIPDFIPVLGFVDDALLLPALIWLAIRLLPDEVLARSRERADEWLASGARRPRRPRSRVGAVLIVGVWLLCIALAAHWWPGRA